MKKQKNNPKKAFRNWILVTLGTILFIACIEAYSIQEIRNKITNILFNNINQQPTPIPVLVSNPTPVPIAISKPMSEPSLTPQKLVTITVPPTSAPVDPIKWILDHQDYSPKEVALLVDTSFPVKSGGVPVGSANVPAGNIVQVIEIDPIEKKITVAYPAYGNTQKTLSIESTDLIDRAKTAIVQAKVDAQTPHKMAVVTAVKAPISKTNNPTRFEKLPGDRDEESRLPYLSTSGKQIVDGQGNPVVLRGVNIGGWLVTEAWMCGEKNDCGRGALELLEERFGPERASKLMNSWYDNWFTSRDLDKIQSYGFNLIRVPFSNRNFQNSKGEWIRDAKGEIDFSRLDWVVREAAKRNIYVILDFHVWPQQIEKDNYGLPSRWSENGKAVRASMAATWKEIAKHFRGNGTIAGFDVINEPEGSPGDAPHHAFYDAIRSEDPDRIVIIEWVSYPNFLKTGWTNVVWSTHYPEETLPEGTKDASLEQRLAAFDKKEGISASNVQVPIYVGETKAVNDDAKSAGDLATAFNSRGWSWTVWTYKGVNNGGWASFNYNSSLACDLKNDSFDYILHKWSVDLRDWQDENQSSNYWFTDWWIHGYTQNRNITQN